MGSAIARHMASHGVEVIVIDDNDEQLSRAQQAAGDLPVNCTSDISLLADAQYVIEAVFEDLTVKRQVLAMVDEVVRPDCIIATNTSSLLVRDLATAVTQPNRFLGVHYNNPADINPIVEIIATDATDEACATEIFNWMRGAGKQAIRCADTSGFILNRQSLPYINEAARCLDIARPGEVDFVATKQLGVGLGPFAVMNLVGLPVMAASSKNLSVLGEGYKVAESLASQAATTPPIWQIAEVTRVGDALSQILADRLLGAMMFPGKDILDQELTSREDLHLICIEALGYQRSSPELLEQLDSGIVAKLIADYLEWQSGT